MKFKNSPYYNEEFLGKSLYERIINNDEIFSVQEFFGINAGQIEYHIKETNKDYNLKVQDYYYELDCQKYQSYLYIVFDKPVHITGKYCIGLIVPEIVVKNENDFLSGCVANKIIINNSYKGYYEIGYSKFNNIYFYNEKVQLNISELDNFFIFNKDLQFSSYSIFLEGSKIKCFGPCKNLKEKLLNIEKFKERIIHIE